MDPTHFEMSQTRPSNVTLSSTTFRLHPLRNPRVNSGRVPSGTPLCLPTSNPTMDANIPNERIDDPRLIKILDEYRDIVNGVNRGETVEASCDRLEWTAWTFKRNKVIADLMLAEPKKFKREFDRLAKRDLKTVHQMARQITLNPSTRREIERLASVGQTLL